MAKTDVKSMTLEELQLFMGELGEPKFRAKQIFDWLHQKQVDTFAEMTNLSQKLRERLEQEAKIGGVEMVERLLSKEDGTRKYLFALENGSIIESVLMQYDYGNTVCVSTQAGCRMGCKFCASTLDGVERSLTPAEMLSQVYTIQKDLGQRISGVVLMGSGEPLDNYDNVLRFIHLLNDPAGQNMGQRHITLSTCGLIEKMYRLAEENLQITLAVWKTEERLNTAAAAKEVSESGDLTMAAVGSPYAAEHFGLQILKEGIFDARGTWHFWE